MGTKTKIIKPNQENLKEFIFSLQEHLNYNVVVDLSEKSDINIADLKLFLHISIVQSERKKSLVLVVKNINFNTLPKSIIVVPTLQEAHDLIEMDEIERDLGF
jgi:hypothetical protein